MLTWADTGALLAVFVLLFGLQVAFVHPDAAHGVLSELVAR